MQKSSLLTLMKHGNEAQSFKTQLGQTEWMQEAEYALDSF
jgi:hypothetical protein